VCPAPQVAGGRKGSRRCRVLYEKLRVAAPDFVRASFQVNRA
jgi:hypothetical protein